MASASQRRQSSGRGEVDWAPGDAGSPHRKDLEGMRDTFDRPVAEALAVELTQDEPMRGFSADDRASLSSIRQPRRHAPRFAGQRHRLVVALCDRRSGMDSDPRIHDEL